MSVNRVVLVGRLGQDPETRVSKGGHAWGNIRVATNTRRRDGERWVEQTEWHTVKVFGKQAENCQAYLRRGSMVGVEGRLSYDHWEDEEKGVKRERANVMADRVTFLSPPLKDNKVEAAAAD